MNSLENWAELCLRTMDENKMSSSTSLVLIFNLEAFKNSPYTEGVLEELVMSKLMLRELKDNDNDQFR